MATTTKTTTKAAAPKAEKPVEKTVSMKEWLNELVDFRAFKDGQKYKDDIFVSLNGKSYQIERGVTVKIPRKIALILENSAQQDQDTANLIESESRKFQNEAKKLG